MSEKEKCCGSCKHAKPVKHVTHLIICEAPLPDAACLSVDHDGVMEDTDGVKCPCHEPREVK